MENKDQPKKKTRADYLKEGTLPVESFDDQIESVKNELKEIVQPKSKLSPKPLDKDEGNRLRNVLISFASETYPAYSRGSSGCVIEGTTVLVKDDKEGVKGIRIEEVRPNVRFVFDNISKTWKADKRNGDKVLTIDGKFISVIAKVVGPERKFPVVDLLLKAKKYEYKDNGEKKPPVRSGTRKSENIRLASVSKWHSFLRADNMLVQAYQLIENDSIFTSYGEASILDIEHKTQEESNVWNLILGDDKFLDDEITSLTADLIGSMARISLFGLKAKDHIFYTGIPYKENDPNKLFGAASGSYGLQLQLLEYFRNGIHVNDFA